MAYTSGGTIQAIDYNYFTWGGNTTSTYGNTTPNLAFVWGNGKGVRGYGQDVSLISAVSITPLTTTITATQWAGLVYTLNRCLGHQGGAAAQLATGSNIGITAGAVITAFANVATAINTISTNANTYTALGTTTTGTTFTNQAIFGAGPTTAANSYTFGRRITFASGDAARYFFNAGGRIRWYANATNVNGTLRSADLVTNWGTNQGGGEISGGASLGRIGTGGTVNANVTTAGYWGLGTANITVSRITSSNYRYEYNQDFTLVNVRVTGTNVGGNGDNGSVIELYANVFMQGAILGPTAFNDTVNVNLGWRVDIVQPETTYLANTWGVIGITQF
jgi:hypothetical protein